MAGSLWCIALIHLKGLSSDDFGVRVYIIAIRLIAMGYILQIYSFIPNKRFMHYDAQNLIIQVHASINCSVCMYVDVILL